MRVFVFALVFSAITIPIHAQKAVDTIDNDIEKIGPYKLREVTHSTDRSGNTKTIVTVHICDGKENPIEGSPESMTLTCDPATYNFVVKKDGKPMMEVQTDFSADDRTITIIGIIL
jgi:hypothetical protein